MGTDFVTPNPFQGYPIRFLLLILFTTFKFSAAAKLDPQEVKALRKIGGRFGKKDWDFGKDPCSGEGNWKVVKKSFESSVTCDCSFNHNTTCHVVSIQLKSQNLTGAVPPEFSTFPYLKYLDLSRNLLNGSIPEQWGTMGLVNLSIEGNLFSGPIPQEIGNLVNIERLHLSSNTFTGKLPVALAKLINLRDMRISDNNFSGKIPDFIKNWTHMEKLHIHGCSFQGPIPSSIDALMNLSDLRITDLKGRGSPFPPLNNLNIKTLILRKCLIYGEIPGYIGDMKKLKHLDLSYNNLSGKIPESETLKKIDFIYLTGNNLNGHVPDWMLNRIQTTDISYNNFTRENSSPDECQPRGTVNIVESYASSANKKSKAHPCLEKNFPCPGASNHCE